jgi:hypothetical protein
MARGKSNYRNCFLCRIMRGMAFGGLGAALFGVPAKYAGAAQDTVIYLALFGALLLTVLFNHNRPPRPKEIKNS